jgi:hypothetical protein
MVGKNSAGNECQGTEFADIGFVGVVTPKPVD